MNAFQRLQLRKNVELVREFFPADNASGQAVHAVTSGTLELLKTLEIAERDRDAARRELKASKQ